MFDVLSTETGRNESQQQNPGIGFRNEIYSKSEVTSDLPRWISSLCGMAWLSQNLQRCSWGFLSLLSLELHPLTLLRLPVGWAWGSWNRYNFWNYMALITLVSCYNLSCQMKDIGGSQCPWFLWYLPSIWEDLFVQEWGVGFGIIRNLAMI